MFWLVWYETNIQQPCIYGQLWACFWMGCDLQSKNVFAILGLLHFNLTSFLPRFFSSCSKTLLYFHLKNLRQNPSPKLSRCCTKGCLMHSISFKRLLFGSPFIFMVRQLWFWTKIYSGLPHVHCDCISSILEFRQPLHFSKAPLSSHSHTRQEGLSLQFLLG